MMHSCKPCADFKCESNEDGDEELNVYDTEDDTRSPNDFRSRLRSHPFGFQLLYTFRHMK